jgi:F-type H+-transporting ATPase subunit b
LEKLGINSGYLFLQIINFIVVALLLQFILYKPVVKTLKERRERIAEGLNNARKAEEALASAEVDKQKLLDEARAEAQRILNEARTRADDMAAQIKTEAQAEAQRVLEEARQDANGERNRVMIDMRSQIVSLSLAAASQLLGTTLDENRQRQIVEDFFTHIPPEAKDLGDNLIVITAVPLNADEEERFKTELGAKEVTFRVDPSILGGVIVRAGGQQVDGSFAHQLASMHTSLS